VGIECVLKEQGRYLPNGKNWHTDIEAIAAFVRTGEAGNERERHHINKDFVRGKSIGDICQSSSVIALKVFVKCIDMSILGPPMTEPINC
jgi:hypothetical protein